MGNYQGREARVDDLVPVAAGKVPVIVQGMVQATERDGSVIVALETVVEHKGRPSNLVRAIPVTVYRVVEIL